MDTRELVLLLIVIVLDLFLGVITLLRNHRSWSNRLFALWVVSMVAWLAANFACDQPLFYNHALVLNRLTMALGVLMGIPIIAFAITFPLLRTRISWWWRIGLMGLGVLATLSLFTDAVFDDVHIESWGTNAVQGWLFPYFAAYALLLCVGLCVTLARKYRTAKARQRAQFKYLFLGLAAFSSAILMMGAIMPALTSSNEFAKLSPIATLLLLVPTSYAIVRHRLMDVGFVALRAAAYAVLVASMGGALLALAEAGRSRLVAELGLDPQLVLLAGGLACILGFQPLVAAAKRLTDGLFHRRAYNPSALLAKLASLMASTLEPRHLASALSRKLADEMRLRFAAVIWSSNSTPEVASTQDRLSDADVARLLRLCEAGTVIVADELATDADETALLHQRGIRVLVPLQSEGVLLGVVALGEKSSGSMYSEQDMRFLELLASGTALALKNAQLFDEKTQRVRELTALNQLSIALGADIGLDATLGRGLHEIVDVTRSDAGSIMLLDEARQVLRISSAVGLAEGVLETTLVAIGEGVSGWVAKTGESLILVDDADPRFKGELVRQEIVSAISTPVVAKNRVIGVLNLSRRQSPGLFTAEDLRVATSFAGQLGVAIENARLYADLESTFLGTIAALAAAVDAKDPYTYGHSNEVTTHAVALAEKLGLPEDEVHTIRIAAMLHDIGKLGIDGAILEKPGLLSAEERTAINRHPAIGADILAPLEFLRDEVPLILFHHERYGGGGYPSGISGETIPLGARIISVADSFNAMTSNRPYREGMPVDWAIRELRASAGTQFDPELVEAFVELLVSDRETRVAQDEAQADLPCTLGLVPETTGVRRAI